MTIIAMQLWLTLSKVVVIIRITLFNSVWNACIRGFFSGKLRFSPSDFNFVFGQRSAFDWVLNLNLCMNYINLTDQKKPKQKRVITFGSRIAHWVRLPIHSSNISESGKWPFARFKTWRQVSRIMSTSNLYIRWSDKCKSDNLFALVGNLNTTSHYRLLVNQVSVMQQTSDLEKWH